ncbi:calcium-binding protein [Falsirhodobacter sp. 20TX0035]|uniref:calcium-binding protein n=1 Tax=Falsirhodobacter sp. 20TX0035 TaxID=3022019 RepID=UPI002330B851|nr:calcium-binding protein [Falsirhodobacter sp. 20TX0035]MDB6453330.1 calcium-binding protein [Falsirhodobacter sp. 20TX0035]
MITKDMFGGHMLYTKDMTDAGGPFDKFTDLIPTSSLRYPGGGVTEHLSPEDGSWDAIFGDPGTVGDPARVLTVKEAFSFAAEHNASIDFVLPTYNFLTDGAVGEREPDTAAIDSMMDRVTEMLSGVYGDVDIKSFEIGNEYWGGDTMTATEYGKLANYMSVRLDETIEAYKDTLTDTANFVEPEIGVQNGAWWKTSQTDTQDILDQLGAEARATIDNVVTHHYPKTYDQAVDHDLFYNDLDVFRNAEGLKDVGVHVSEWNMNSRFDEPGMPQMSGMLATFDQMVSEGVTDANIWGNQYKFLSTRLSGMSHNPGEGVAPEDIDVWLTPAGEAYRLLANNTTGTDLKGLKAEDVFDVMPADKVDIHSYGNAEKTVIYLASRSDSSQALDLNLDKLLQEFPGAHISVTSLAGQDIPSTGANEADPHTVKARVEMNHTDQQDLVADGGMLNLSPFGLVQVVVTKAGHGVNLYGQDSVLDPKDDLGEVMTGGSGGDKIYGNLGDDTLHGMSGGDILYGGQGDDVLYGGAGKDVLVGGDGNNLLYGGADSNVLISDDGHSDIITGPDGDLVMITGDSSAKITSNGNDFFSLATKGEVEITGFNAVSDFLKIGYGEDDVLDALDGMSIINDTDILITSTKFGSIKLTGAADQFSEVESALSDQLSDDKMNEYLSSKEDPQNTEDDSAPADSDHLPASEVAKASMFALQGAGSSSAPISADTIAEYISTYVGDINVDQAALMARASIGEDGASSLFYGTKADSIATYFGDEAANGIMKTLYKGYIPSGPDEDQDEGQEPTPVPDDGLPTDPSNPPPVDENTPQPDLPIKPTPTPEAPNPPPPVTEPPLEDGDDGDDEPLFPEIPWEEEPSDEENYPPADDYDDSAASGGGGSCFVATATYGDGRHTDVVELRRLRDEHLVTHPLGRAFIGFYWAVGPTLASFTSPRNLAGRVSKRCIRHVLALAATAQTRTDRIS